MNIMLKKINFFIIIMLFLTIFFTYINKNNLVFANNLSNYEENFKYYLQSNNEYFNQNNEEVISEFTTNFNPNNSPRVHNIKLASIAIDQKIIQPGETFSFNSTVGPTNEENGYKISKVFRYGEETKGFGGGTCQVSTTLYNAVKLAGLKITERHSHSRKVYYVEEGKDAATSYGSSDFKFVNTLSYPVKINSYMQNGSITIQIIKIY